MNKIKTQLNRLGKTIEDNQVVITQVCITYITTVAIVALFAVKALDEENNQLHRELGMRDFHDTIKIRVFLNEKGEDIEIPMTPSAE